MGKVELTPLKKAVAFRKIAMGTWGKPLDPTVYGQLDVPMDKSLEFIKRFEEKTGKKLSPLYLVAKALSVCVVERPEINAMIRGHKIYNRKKVRLFFQVKIDGEGKDQTKKADLSGVSIDAVEDLSLAEIGEAIQSKAKDVRTGNDKVLKKSIGLVKLLPWWSIKHYLNFTSWLIYGLNLNLSFLGFPKDPFGTALITNVGSLGIDVAWAPLCNYTRTPLVLALGAIQNKPWVENGQLVVKPVMSIGVTFDHRVIDGVHAAKMAKTFKQCLANPEEYLN